MSWEETKVHMTVDGDDLVLDEGQEWGYFETDKNDAGALRNYGVKVLLELAENPASTGTSRYTLQWKYSTDDVTWTDYKDFYEGEYYFRYAYWKVTVYGDLATSQRPKLTHFEAAIGPVDALSVVNSVITQQAAPPASPSMGDAYIVTVGTDAWLGHNNEIAYCIESNTPTWRFIPNIEGMGVYEETLECRLIVNASGGWESEDARKIYGVSVHRHGDGYNAIYPASGTWTYTNDQQQDSCGYIETATGAASATGDYAEYEFGLTIGSYTLVLKTFTGPACGKVDVILDGVTLVNVDMYSASPVNNVRKVQTPITVSTATTHTLRFVTNGKNGSSSGYDQYISWFEMFPV